MSANPADRFAYDPEQHEYRIDGVRVPSVTEILGILTDFSGIPDAVLENARDRGEKLAKALNLYNRGALDPGSCDDETRSGVDAWAQYLEDTGAVVVESETPVFHVGLKYAGTPDCVLAVGNRYKIPDVKASYAPPPTVGAQTSAYAAAWTERTRKGTVLRECVHIRNGRYTIHPRSDPSDWSLFLSAKNCFDFLRRNR